VLYFCSQSTTGSSVQPTPNQRFVRTAVNMAWDAFLISSLLLPYSTNQTSTKGSHLFTRKIKHSQLHNFQLQRPPILRLPSSSLVDLFRLPKPATSPSKTVQSYHKPIMAKIAKLQTPAILVLCHTIPYFKPYTNTNPCGHLWLPDTTADDMWLTRHLSHVL